MEFTISTVLQIDMFCSNQCHIAYIEDHITNPSHLIHTYILLEHYYLLIKLSPVIRTLYTLYGVR